VTQAGEDLDETSHKGYQIYKIKLLLKGNLKIFSDRVEKIWPMKRTGGDRTKGEKVDGS